MFIFVVNDKVSDSAAISKQPGAIVWGTFYFTDAAIRDWTQPQNNSLWQDNIKNLFDPCPVGWRVPQSGDESSGRSPWRSFTLDNATRNNPYPGNEAGFFWKSPQCSDGSVWYPPTGWRNKLVINSTGASAHYLAASALNNSGRAFYFNISTILPFYAVDRTGGFSVRCIRE